MPPFSTVLPARLLAPSLMTLAACDLSAIDDLSKVCGVSSIEEVASQDGISDECREAIASALPTPSNNLAGNLVVSGDDLDTDGNLVVYAHGFDATTSPLTLADFETATVTVVLDGVETPVDTLVAPVAGEDRLSVALVTDYSASMTDNDLALLSDMYVRLVEGVPLDYQGESLAFSDTVIRRSEYTEDKAALSAAVAFDTTLERGSTALYDGLGAAATDMLNARPMRLIVCATDGLENASVEWQKEPLRQHIDDTQAAVVMIGTLFADVQEMNDLMGRHGTYIYAADFEAVGDAFDRYVESVGNAVAVTVPGGATEVRIQIEGIETTWTPSGL